MARPSSARIGLALSIALSSALPAAQAQPRDALDPAALARVQRMADRLRSLPSLRVEAEVEYDAVQRDGQAIEFGSIREIAVRRPDRIRALATDRSGAERSLLYDGKQVVVHDLAQGVYAAAEKSGGIDEVLRFSEEQIGVPVPFGELLSSELGERLRDELVFAAIVGEETLDGVRCDHLALRNADRGIQLWIEQGTAALPRRVVITYEQAPGRPQFRARLTKWELAPTLPDSLFVFEPPDGVERIRFHERPAAPGAGGGR